MFTTNKVMKVATLALLVTALGIPTVYGATTKPAPAAKASLTLLSPKTGSILVGQKQTIKWTSKNYTDKKVSVNLIKKVADNPARYELVRTIAVGTSNDNAATWVPSKNDVGDGLSLEIGCAKSKVACSAGESTASTLAVKDSNKYLNVANAFQAIEQKENK